ncbi:MAG: acetolactate synthase small subunit [Ignavibacteriaceae bacterium]
MKHTISVLVENQFGAFNRVATMFSGKGFNIHSIEDKIIEQVVKQLNRLIDTIKVVDLTGQNRVERELALITVFYQKGTRAEIISVSDIFRGNVVDINNKTITLEITGPPDKIDAVINVLEPYGIKEMARSGTVALKRGEQLKHEKLALQQ